ncbi:hypothetical protein CHCC15322_4099 [Bacillus licheniformis]|nr:hypothetical protein CHCC15322_4099 [Bacillus licheniformis]
MKQIRLVKKAVAGNAKAFEMLFQKHSEQLTYMCEIRRTR